MIILNKEMLTSTEEAEWRSLHDHNNSKELDKYFEKCSYCGKRAYNFYKAPSKVIVEIWVMYTQCYKCKKITPVIWPVEVNINSLVYSLRFGTFKKLPDVLSKEFPFFKMTFKKTKNVEDFGNLCINCDAYQGDFFVFEEYLEASYESETVEKKYIEVELDDSERLYFSKHENVQKLHHPKKGNFSALCDDCYKLYKSKKI